MKKETAFWMALAIATVSAVFAIFAFSQPAVEPAPVTAPVPEPIVITIPAPTDEAPAKFKVGDTVNVEGIPAEVVSSIKIVEVQGMANWTNMATGEEVVMRAYLVELTSPDGTQTAQIRVPEIVISAKQ